MNNQAALAISLIGLAISAQAIAQPTVNGFATIAIGVADNDSGYLGYSQDLDLQPDSKAGVQIGYKVNDKIDATVQLLARGSDSWEPEMEWAYVSYHLDGGETVRVGKLRLPFYMYSDYLDVGYAQPFLRSPTSVYTLNPLFDSYTGIDALIPIEISGSTVTLQPFYGGIDDESQGTTFKLSNIAGANVSWEWQNLTVRAIYAQGEFTESNTDELLGADAGFSGLGFKYDADDWFITAEYAMTEVDGIIYDSDGAYVALGYRLGEWTPYISLGMVKTTDNSERDPLLAQLSGAVTLLESLGTAPVPDNSLAALGIGAGTPANLALPGVQNNANRLSGFTFERKEYSIGTRWDFMAGVALKADLTVYDDFNGTAGFSDDYYQVAESSVTIFSVALDAVF